MDGGYASPTDCYRIVLGYLAIAVAGYMIREVGTNKSLFFEQERNATRSTANTIV